MSHPRRGEPVVVKRQIPGGVGEWDAGREVVRGRYVKEAHWERGRWVSGTPKKSCGLCVCKFSEKGSRDGVCLSGRLWSQHLARLSVLLQKLAVGKGGRRTEATVLHSSHVDVRLHA